MKIWDILISAPTGTFKATLEVMGASDDASGKMSAKGGTGEMENLRVSDEKMSWATKIEKPMPMKLGFDGQISDDTVSGKVKFGIFASGTFTGTLRSAA